MSRTRSPVSSVTVATCFRWSTGAALREVAACFATVNWDGGAAVAPGMPATASAPADKVSMVVRRRPIDLSPNNH
ncbi:hypothetical protein GCM10023317_83250 [Actinopolymorpha pittospori]